MWKYMLENTGEDAAECALIPPAWFLCIALMEAPLGAWNRAML